MRRVKIVMVGTFSMLMDPMTQEILENLALKRSSTSDKDVTLKERAEKRLIMDEEGFIGIPMNYLRAALITGGRRVKYGTGRGNLSTAESTNFYTVVHSMTGEGMVDDVGDFLRFETIDAPLPSHKKKEFFLAGENKVAWCVDVRRGVGETSGITNAIVRPMIPKEYIRFSLVVEYDETLMNEAGISQLFTEAGRNGIGAFRPECKGPFGRLEVKSLMDISPEEWIAASKSNSGNVSTKRGSKKKVVVAEVDGISSEQNGQLVGASSGE